MRITCSFNNMYSSHVFLIGLIKKTCDSHMLKRRISLVYVGCRKFMFASHMSILYMVCMKFSTNQFVKIFLSKFVKNFVQTGL